MHHSNYNYLLLRSKGVDDNVEIREEIAHFETVLAQVEGYVANIGNALSLPYHSVVASLSDGEYMNLRKKLLPA